MEYLLFVVSLILWLWLRSRVVDLAHDLAALPEISRQEFGALTRRVYELERRGIIHTPEAPASPLPWQSAPPATAPEPAIAPRPEAPREAPPVEVRAPAPAAPAPPAPPAASFIPPPRVEIPRGPTLVERLRAAAGEDEWEALIGGSLLNKLGAVLVVIGIAIFLAYKFAHMGAAGRASIALAVSLGMLGAGVWTERRAGYRVFARGLIGAGWAALYAASYAIWALPEARIIGNPILGSLVMTVVALGMIAHSLRYRSQAVTGVAYFAAFAALAVTPSTPFAVASLIPIAVSILYLAARFGWYAMPLYGLLATYLTCISRGQSGAPLAASQTLFLAYWVIFEGFDLIRLKRRVLAGGVEFLFPLNAAAFLGLSYLAWSQQAPERLWVASACAAALYLASAIARALLRPPSAFEEPDDLFQRFRYGSFEAATLVSAGLAAMAVVGRAPGMWGIAGLAIEAETLYLAGVRFDSLFLRTLGNLWFVLSLGRIFAGQTAEARTEIAGHAFHNWTPAILFHSALFYLNRGLRMGRAYFSYAATTLVAIAILAETPSPWLGLGWAAFAFALLQFGMSRRLREFRVQAYTLFGASVCATVLITIANPHDAWWGLAATLALVYACALQSRWTPSLDDRERKFLSVASTVCACGLAALLTWRTVPVDYLAVAWAALALAAFELGAVRLPPQLRAALAPLLTLAVIGTAATHGSALLVPVPSASLPYYAIALVAWIAAAQFTLVPPAAARAWEKTHLRDALTALGIVMALIATWLTIPAAAVSLIWIAIALLVLEAGVALRLPSFYWISLIAVIATYARLFVWDLNDAAPFAGIPHRLLTAPICIAAFYWVWRRFGASEIAPAVTVARLLFWMPLVPALWAVDMQAGTHHAALGWAAMALALQIASHGFQLPDARRQALIIGGLTLATALIFDVEPSMLSVTIPAAACLYAAQWIATRAREDFAAAAFSIMATLLASALLFGAVSGGLLTVSWGLLSLALLAAGFLLRDRVLRLQGLFLLLTCILKLFVYDLRNLDTPYRILSFVALGLILLGVSWIYTRFREQIARLL